MKFWFHVSNRLSAYCEGELSADEKAHIEAHLESCADCRARCEETRKNAHLLHQVALREPADELWYRIAQELSLGGAASARVSSARTSSGWRNRRVLRLAVAAACLMVIATGLLLASRYGLLRGDQRGELNLASYLDLVGTVASAQSELTEFPAAPGFTTVSLSEVRATLDFPIIGPESLPEGYRLTTARLYTCEGVTALQLKYRSERGGLCVFQLPANLKLSFGDRQSERCTAGGVQCRRTFSTGCYTYGFILGDTRCVIMTGQADQGLAEELINALKAEYERIQQLRR